VNLLTLVAPGGEGHRAAVSAALAAWTRGLDIRLRFLNIGVEEEVLVLAAGDGAPAAVEAALLRRRPGVVLLHGRGPSALAAAIAASKAGVPLVRTAAGGRDGAAGDEDRAADRLCQARLSTEGEALAALEAEGLPGEPFTPEAAVRAVIRLHREG
jgi:hypothetical protein